MKKLPGIFSGTIRQLLNLGEHTCLASDLDNYQAHTFVCLVCGQIWSDGIG